MKTTAAIVALAVITVVTLLIVAVVIESWKLGLLVIVGHFTFWLLLWLAAFLAAVWVAADE